MLKPWMAEAMTHVIATEDPPLTPSRRRPYIYVYDMKPDYSTDYWQYRIEAAHCIYRWVLGCAVVGTLSAALAWVPAGPGGALLLHGHSGMLRLVLYRWQGTSPCAPGLSMTEGPRDPDYRDRYCIRTSLCGLGLTCGPTPAAPLPNPAQVVPGPQPQRLRGLQRLRRGAPATRAVPHLGAQDAGVGAMNSKPV